MRLLPSRTVLLLSTSVSVTFVGSMPFAGCSPDGASLGSIEQHVGAVSDLCGVTVVLPSPDVDPAQGEWEPPPFADRFQDDATIRANLCGTGTIRRDEGGQIQQITILENGVLNYLGSHDFQTRERAEEWVRRSIQNLVGLDDYAYCSSNYWGEEQWRLRTDYARFLRNTLLVASDSPEIRHRMGMLVTFAQSVYGSPHALARILIEPALPPDISVTLRIVDGPTFSVENIGSCNFPVRSNAQIQIESAYSWLSGNISMQQASAMHQLPGINISTGAAHPVSISSYSVPRRLDSTPPRPTGLDWGTTTPQAGYSELVWDYRDTVSFFEIFSQPLPPFTAEELAQPPETRTWRRIATVNANVRSYWIFDVTRRSGFSVRAHVRDDWHSTHTWLETSWTGAVSSRWYGCEMEPLVRSTVPFVAQNLPTPSDSSTEIQSRLCQALPHIASDPLAAAWLLEAVRSLLATDHFAHCSGFSSRNSLAGMIADLLSIPTDDAQVREELTRLRAAAQSINLDFRFARLTVDQQPHFDPLESLRSFDLLALNVYGDNGALANSFLINWVECQIPIRETSAVSIIGRDLPWFADQTIPTGPPSEDVFVRVPNIVSGGIDDLNVPIILSHRVEGIAPPPPTNLRIDPPTGGYARLSWEANSAFDNALTGFEIRARTQDLLGRWSQWAAIASLQSGRREYWIFDNEPSETLTEIQVAAYKNISGGRLIGYSNSTVVLVAETATSTQAITID